MEAVGIAASIVGLLAAGAQLVPWLANVASKIADAPESVNAVLSELRETTMILEEVQLYILEKQIVAEDRRTLIRLEHISVILTGFVVTYSDLEKHVDTIHPVRELSGFDRAKWLLKEKEILDVTRRLQGHKGSLSIMLTLIQDRSQRDTYRDLEVKEVKELVLKLYESVDRSLSQDQSLLAQLERRGTKQGTATMLPIPDVASFSNGSIYGGGDSSTYASTRASRSSRLSLPSAVATIRGLRSKRSNSMLMFGFEKDLQSSWVYKRSGFGFFSQSKTSLLSRQGTERGMAMSALSGRSWAEISHLSVYNLPVLQCDIYNGFRYAVEVEENSGSITPTPSIYDSKIEDHDTTRVLGPGVDSIWPKTPSSSLPIIHIYPDLPEDSFIGRESILQSIRFRLQPGWRTTLRQNMPVYILWGPLGSGKTRIALEYIRSLLQPSRSLSLSPSLPIAHRYILWVDAKTQQSICSAFLRFGEQLGFQHDVIQHEVMELGSYKPDVNDYYVDRVLRYLTETDQKWLIIFDNVNDSTIIEPYGPVNPNGAILITTRDRGIYFEDEWAASRYMSTDVTGLSSPKAALFWAAEWDAAEVPGLTPEPAMKLLVDRLKQYRASRSLLGIENNHPEVAHFINIVGSSPANITAVAHAIGRNMITIDAISRHGDLYPEAFKRIGMQNIYGVFRAASVAGMASDDLMPSLEGAWLQELNHLARVGDIALVSPGWGEQINATTPRSSCRGAMLMVIILLSLTEHGLPISLLQRAAEYLYPTYGSSVTVFDQPCSAFDLPEDLMLFQRILGCKPDSDVLRPYHVGSYSKKQLLCLGSDEIKQVAFDVVSRLLSDLMGPSNPTENNPSATATLSAETFSHFKALHQFFTFIFPIPGWSGTFSVKFLTVLRKFISITNRGSGFISTGHSSEIFQCLNTIEKITSIPDIKNLLYGKSSTVSFELAACHTILARIATNIAHWDAAVHHYKMTEKYYARMYSTERDAPEPVSLQKYFSKAKRQDKTDIIPHHKVVLFNTKLARCLYASGEIVAANDKLVHEIALPWYRNLNYAGLENPPDWQSPIPWSQCFSYVGGYTYLTLGILLLKDKEILLLKDKEILTEVIGNLEPAIHHLTDCKDIKESWPHLATAYSLLGHAHQKLGDYAVAVEYLEQGHSTYLAIDWGSDAFKFEVRKRIRLLKQILTELYDFLNTSMRTDPDTGKDMLPLENGGQRKLRTSRNFEEFLNLFSPLDMMIDEQIL